MNDLLGRRLGGKYEIQAEIGRGGMGVVYRGRDLMLQRAVAIKVLPKEFTYSEQFVQRFRQEAIMAAGLHQANIVTIHDVGEEDGVHFIVMQFLEGVTLDQWLNSQGPMPLAQANHLVRQMAEALDYAHGRGIVHRDIKPSNIMVGPNGQITLMDFGLVRAGEGSGLTRTGMIMGTPEYMAPEQAVGSAVDRRTDIYSFGVVIYKLLTGVVPFARTTPVATAHAHVYEAPPPLRQVRPDLPKPLEALVMKALAKDPAQRYQRASDLAADFAVAAAGKSPAGKRVAPAAVLAKQAATPPPRSPQPAPAAVLEAETQLVGRVGAGDPPPAPPTAAATPAAPAQRRSSPTGLLLAVIAGLAVILLAGAVWTLSRPERDPGGPGTNDATSIPVATEMVTTAPETLAEAPPAISTTPTATSTTMPATSTTTPTATWTSTATATPTSSPTNSPSATPELTATPRPTNTPTTAPATAVPTAASADYRQAPAPVSPAEGAGAAAEQTFSWRWDETALRADERFDWRLLRGRTGEDVVDVRQAREPSLVYPFTNLPSGDYFWSVRVIRVNGDGGVSVLSPESVRWPIRWSAPSPPSPTDPPAPPPATPMPTNTPPVSRSFVPAGDAQDLHSAGAGGALGVWLFMVVLGLNVWKQRRWR